MSLCTIFYFFWFFVFWVSLLYLSIYLFNLFFLVFLFGLLTRSREVAHTGVDDEPSDFARLVDGSTELTFEPPVTAEVETVG